MIGILGLSVFFGSKIRFEEDITKMLPSDKNIAKINLVSQNLNFADKLVISISLSDTNSTAAPEKLIDIADKLYSGLTAFQPDYISEITYSVSENIISDVYDIYLNNLPIFLEEDDYFKIDSLLSQSAIDKAIKNNYKTLKTSVFYFLI